MRETSRTVSILSFIGAVIALIASLNASTTVKSWLSDDALTEPSVVVAARTADSVYWLAVAVGLLLVSIAFAVVPLWSRKPLRH